MFQKQNVLKDLKQKIQSFGNKSLMGFKQKNFSFTQQVLNFNSNFVSFYIFYTEFNMKF